eukprot:s6091_g6.t1
MPGSVVFSWLLVLMQDSLPKDFEDAKLGAKYPFFSERVLDEEERRHSAKEPKPWRSTYQDVLGIINTLPSMVRPVLSMPAGWNWCDFTLPAVAAIAPVQSPDSTPSAEGDLLHGSQKIVAAEDINWLAPPVYAILLSFHLAYLQRLFLLLYLEEHLHLLWELRMFQISLI